MRCERFHSLFTGSGGIKTKDAKGDFRLFRSSEHAAYADGCVLRLTGEVWLPISGL